MKFLKVLAFLVFSTLSASAQNRTISLIQHTSIDAGATTRQSLTFAAPNLTHNWIAVVIRAGNKNQSFIVHDSNANVYQQAAQLQVTVDAPNGDVLAIFYAENVKPGANTVTVEDTFTSTLRFSILEYSGVAQANSLDSPPATAQGVSNAPNTGLAGTSNNGDLWLAAIDTADGEQYTAGPKFNAEEFVPTNGLTKLIVEDQVQQIGNVLVAGTATLGASDPWGAILVAFKAQPISYTFNVSGTILFEDGTPFAIAPRINVQQSSPGVNLQAGIIILDARGNLTGQLIIDPTLADAAGFITLQFSVNGVGATIAQTFPLQVFQQGSTGINLSLVLFKSMMLPKSFSAGLLP